MLFLGLFLILFGIIVISNPAILAYLIGFFFVFLGVNVLTLFIMARRAQGGSRDSSWKVGSYEIIRRKK